MKNLKNLFSILGVSVLLIVAAQSCTKGAHDSNTVTASEDYETVDNSTISEEYFDDFQIDPIEDIADGATPTITISGGTQAANADGDGGCSVFKYDGKSTYKIGGSGETFTLALSSMAIVDSIRNENTATGYAGDPTKKAKAGGGLSFSDISNTSTASQSITVKLSPDGDTFRTGSAKMVVYMRVKLKDTSTTYTQVKKRSVTIKVIGKDEDGNVFGTAKWGYAKEGGDGAKYIASVAAIDSNYVPAIGDLLATSDGNKRGIITSVETIAAGTTASAIAKGTKYKTKYVIWNATCKSSRKAGSATWYRKVTPTAKVDGVNVLTHKVE